MDDEGKQTNILTIVHMDLCTGCGTCCAFCLHDAIFMREDLSQGILVPGVDTIKCSSCGTCLRLCPGYEVDFHKLNSYFYGRQPELPLLGNYVQCLSGMANNHKISNSVSSGGIVTQLLIFALKKSFITGALVTRMSGSDPLKTESLIATTTEEIVSAAGSKYCPCSANVSLRQLQRKAGKLAVVGLPCHVHALRKAMLIFPWLRERISLIIGLFCAHSTSYRGTEAVVRRLKLQRNQVSSIAYRGCGWPGKLSLTLSNGGLVQIPYSRSFRAYYPLFDSPICVPWRCMFCQDHFNELSDISVGDAWLPDYSHGKIGRSLFIVRTETAMAMLKEAVLQNEISVRAIQPERVIKSQSRAVKVKTEFWVSRLSAATRIGKKTPVCSVTFGRGPSVSSHILSILTLRLALLSRNPHIFAMLTSFPFWLYRLHNMSIEFVNKFA